MNASVTTLRKSWPVLAVVGVLATVALVAGTLFAANERQQPEARPQPQQSVAGAADPSRIADLPSDPPAPERVPAQQDDNEVQIDLPPVTKQPPAHPNLDTNLNRVVEQAAGSSNPASTENAAPAPSDDPVLVTFYVEPENIDALRQYLEGNDVYVRNVGEDYIEAHVPPLLLPTASEQPGVLRVDTVIPPQPAQSQNRVISQGVGLHGADAWHSAGYRGQGVKIGIIDAGFEEFSRLQRGGELPPNVFARCYFEGPRPPSSLLSDCETDGDHGTAVAEAVIDVAPDAQLYISQPVSDGDLRNAVDWMAGHGVEVINYSVGKVVDGPGDGTSPFSDSPLRTVDAAVSAGITWVAAAGNSARNVWYGTFSDPDNDGRLNFAPRDQANNFTVQEGDRAVIFMRWDDSWDRADCDLDLEIYRARPGSNVASRVGLSNRVQDGSAGRTPLEVLGVDEVPASLAGRSLIAITKHSCVDEPRWIQLTAWIEDDLEYYSPGHHIGNPQESRNSGFLAVGATHYWDTNTIASYSSRGPTIDGRTKPEITGVACGRLSVDAPVTLPNGNQCWFAGTSQAAPHVAGLAALVKQRTPHFSPSHVARFLMDNAQKRGMAGPDNTWGHGFADLPDPSVDIPPMAGDPIAAQTVTVGDTVVVHSTITNTDVGHTLTWMGTSSDDMIATATVDSMGIVTITGVAAGMATITVTATDAAGASASQTIAVTVNAAPMVGDAIAAQTVAVGEMLIVQSTITDADMGDTLTWSAESDRPIYATATVDSMGIVTITGVAAGMATITVTATDAAGASAMQPISVTVTEELTTPSNLRVNPVGSGIVLVDWDPVTGAAGFYIIATNLADTSDHKTAVINNPSATSGAVDDLTVGEEYLIFVYSFKSSTEFLGSDYVRITAE